jgi:hypothetical protein
MNELPTGRPNAEPAGTAINGVATCTGLETALSPPFNAVSVMMPPTKPEAATCASTIFSFSSPRADVAIA